MLYPTESTEEHWWVWQTYRVPHHGLPDQGGVLPRGHRQSAQHRRGTQPLCT